MRNKGQAYREKLLLTLSCAAALLLTTPAWKQGIFFVAIAMLLTAAFIFKTNVQGLCRVLRKPKGSGYLAMGILCSVGFGCNFYHSWSESASVVSITKAIGANWLVPMLTVVLTVMAAPAFTGVIGHYLSSILAAYRHRSVPEKGRFSPGTAALVLFLVYTVGISAILRTNFYYQDDVSRAAYGYKQWDYFGRFLSTALATLVHAGDYLTDIAPLPQLLAVGIMAVSGVMLLGILYDRWQFSAWELVSVVSLALNPYFLECLSFRFDAPYMAMSVLAGIAPLLFWNRGTKTYVFAAMLGTLGVCTSYQAASGIFPMLVILLAVLGWNRGEPFRKQLSFCLYSAAGYLMGLAYFYLVLMRPANAGYVSNQLPGAGGLIPNILGNLSQYWRNLVLDMKLWWLGMMGLILVAFLVLTARNRKRPLWASLTVTILGILAMAVVCFGAYIALSSALFSPRAMYGFGVMLAALCAEVCRGKGSTLIRMPVVALVWAFFVFSFTYGNALDLQKEYTEFRIQLVIQDLNDLGLTADTMKTVKLSGDIGRAPVLDNMPQDYQILNRLIPSTFAGGDDLCQYRFFCYYGLPMQMATSENWQDRDLPLLKDTLYHTIYGDEGQLRIELKDN